MRGVAGLLLITVAACAGNSKRDGHEVVPVTDKIPHLPGGGSGGDTDKGTGHQEVGDTPDGTNQNRPSSDHRADFQPCEPSIEDHKPGNYDRYSFEDAKSGLIGFRNGSGAIVIPARFRFAYEFGDGGIAAAIDGTTPFVFIDSTGKTIAKAYAYDNGPDYFEEGLARIVDSRGKVGYIDTSGKIAIAPQFDDAASFCHGKAEVAAGGKTYVIDTAGKTVAP
jgi:hypothetical protein